MAVRPVAAPDRCGGLKVALSADQTDSFRGSGLVLTFFTMSHPSSWRILSQSTKAFMELPTNSLCPAFTAIKNSGRVWVAGAHILMACVPGKPSKLASTRCFRAS